MWTREGLPVSRDIAALSKTCAIMMGSRIKRSAAAQTAQFGGRDAGPFAEDLPEMALAFITDRNRHIENGKRRRLDEVARLLHALARQPDMRRAANGLLEGTGEME